MYKYLYILFFLNTLLYSQEPISKLQLVNFGNINYDHVSGLLYHDNSIYICGYFSGNLYGNISKGGTDAFLAKFDSNSQLIWVQSFGGLFEDRAHQLTYDSLTEKILLTGYYTQTLYFGTDSLVSKGDEDVFVVASDTAGDFIWAKSFGATGIQSASSIITDDIGNIYICGYFADSLFADNNLLVSRGIRNAFLLQLDSYGNTNWAKRMGGDLYDEGLNLVCDASNNVYLSGIYRDSADFGPFQSVSVFTYDCFLTSLDISGNWRWFKSFGGGYLDNCPALAYMPKSGDVLTGGWFFNDISFQQDTTLYSTGEEESFIARFDSLGNLIIAQRIGSEMAELIFDISVDKDDNILIVGTFDSVIIIGSDSLFAKHYNRPTDIFAMGFGPDLKYKWAYRAGSVFNDFGTQCTWADSNRFYLSGNFFNSTVFDEDSIISNGNYDIYLAKMLLDTTNIKPNSNIDYKLPNLNVFPNPTDDFLIISSDLQEFNFKVYSINAVLISEFHNYKSNYIDLKDYQKGVYIIQFYNKDFSKTYKIIKH